MQHYISEAALQQMVALSHGLTGACLKAGSSYPYWITVEAVANGQLRPTECCRKPLGRWKMSLLKNFDFGANILALG